MRMRRCSSLELLYLIKVRNTVRKFLLDDLEYQQLFSDKTISDYTRSVIRTNHRDMLEQFKSFNSERGNFLDFVDELYEGTNEGKRKALMFLLSILPEDVSDEENNVEPS